MQHYNWRKPIWYLWYCFWQLQSKMETLSTNFFHLTAARVFQSSEVLILFHWCLSTPLSYGWAIYCCNNFATNGSGFNAWHQELNLDMDHTFVLRQYQIQIDLSFKCNISFVFSSSAFNTYLKPETHLRQQIFKAWMHQKRSWSNLCARVYQQLQSATCCLQSAHYYHASVIAALQTLPNSYFAILRHLAFKQI